MKIYTIYLIMIWLQKGNVSLKTKFSIFLYNSRMAIRTNS